MQINYSDFSEKSLALCRALVIVVAIAAPISTAVASIGMIGILLTWLLSGQVIITLKQSYQHPVGKTIAAFIIWLIIGMFYADNAWSAKITTLLSWQKLFFVFILLGIYQSEEWQRRFVSSYFVFMAVGSALGIGFWLLDIKPRDQEVGIFMTNYVTQSTAFIAALICNFFLIKTSCTNKQRVLLWLVCLLFLTNIFVISPARSGYLAVLPALLVLGISFYGYKKLPHILVMLILLSLVFGLSSDTLQERIKLGVSEQANYQQSEQLTSVGTRMVFYTNSFELIKEKPILGYGTSSFGKTYSHYVAQKYQDWRAGETTDPHNQYLFVLLENGLFGLVLFCLYIVMAIRSGLCQPPYGSIAASFLVAMCATSLFNSHFKTFAEGNLLAFFLGALLAVSPSLTKSAHHA